MTSCNRLGFAAIFPFLISLVFCSSVCAEDSHHEGLSDHREPFGFDLQEGWLNSPLHSHLSPLGTPLIHSFRLEPAFTHRDHFLDYSFRSGPEETEHEIESEFEWALTRRIGLVLEVPYRFVNPADEPSVNGFGDLAISPRFLLAEYHRFLLAFNLEIETPTGNEDLGLGNGEVVLAPSFSAWVDLGSWTTFNTQIGVEHTLESNETELLFRASLIHTLGHPSQETAGQGHHDHLPPGLLSVIFEVDGMIELSGEDDGVVSAEGIVGAYYGLAAGIDLRAGYQFPLSSPRELDGGLVIGLIRHF